MKYWSTYGLCLTFPLDCILVGQTFLVPEPKLHLNVISYCIQNKKYIIHSSSERKGFFYKWSRFKALITISNGFQECCVSDLAGDQSGRPEGAECRDPRQDSIKTNSDKQTNTWSPGPRWDLSVRTILQEFNLKLKLLKYAKLIYWQARFTVALWKTKQRLILMERFKWNARPIKLKDTFSPVLNNKR